MILGEWGTANVDKGDGKTDYDVRRDMLFEFVDYMVQKCKEYNVATFWWMGLSDGVYRSLPAFSQPDLAERLAKAFHGSSFVPVLPKASDFTISFTVDFSQLWSELNLYKGGSFTSADYSSAVLELDGDPVPGLLQWKVYCSKYSNGYTRDITSAESTLAFAASMGTITAITLQCKASNGHVKVKSAKLLKRSGEVDPCSPTVSWGCTISDVTATSTGISSVRQDFLSDGMVYDLSGRWQGRLSAKGVYIRNGKKYVK